MQEETMTLAESFTLLLSERRFQELRRTAVEENPADIAEALGELTPEACRIIYRFLPKELAAEVFVEMTHEGRKALVHSFSDLELKEVLDELYDDDTADLIEEMPASVVKRILKNTSPETRRSVNQLLKYSEDSAGSIMTTEFVHLRREMTVSDALAIIRRDAINKETVYTCYVTDTQRRLLGIVTAKDLLISPLDATMESIMESNVIAANTTDNREDVARMFDKYDFLALPVVDKENRLVGIITVDDAIDVLSEEVEEDFAKIAAITPNETPYLKTSVLSIWRARIPWLLLLMLSATFTGMIISAFEGALAQVVVLTAFIPMLMGTGGNSGSQASVTVIRGLSLGEVQFSDFLRVIWKELRVSVLCGVALAAVTFGKIWLVDYLLLDQPITMPIAFVISITLAVTVIVAKLIGCILPLLAKKLGFDPAVMASPFITTLVDALSLLVYFGIASAVLHL